MLVSCILVMVEQNQPMGLGCESTRPAVGRIFYRDRRQKKCLIGGRGWAAEVSEDEASLTMRTGNRAARRNLLFKEFENFQAARKYTDPRLEECAEDPPLPIGKFKAKNSTRLFPDTQEEEMIEARARDELEKHIMRQKWKKFKKNIHGRRQNSTSSKGTKGSSARINELEELFYTVMAPGNVNATKTASYRGSISNDDDDSGASTNEIHWNERQLRNDQSPLFRMTTKERNKYLSELTYLDECNVTRLVEKPWITVTPTPAPVTHGLE